MRHAFRHFVAEFVGTFALVFVASLSVMMMQGTGAPASVALLVVALAVGLTLAAMTTSLMRISGHFNPAVTLGFVVARRLDGIHAGIYVAGQVLGAVVAAYVTKLLVPVSLYAAARGGSQVISLDVSGWQAFVAEFVATFILVWVTFGSAVDPKAPRVGGLAIGLAMTVGILAIGPLTGGSMNPARAVGPAVAVGIFEGQVIFWLAPLLGGALAALIYDQLFLRRELTPEPVMHGAVDPL